MSVQIPDVFLSATGEKLAVRFEQGLFKTTLDGVDFVSASPAQLVDAVRLFYSVQSNDPQTKPTRSQVLRNVLTNGTSLDERQKALVELNSLSASDVFAREAVQKIQTPPTSIAAKWMVLMLNRKDFAYVTPAEIHEFVTDMKERDALLVELSNRVRL